MRISGPEQMRMVEQYADAALDQIAELLVTHRVEIRRRLALRVSSIGIAEYGDRTWHSDERQLVSEAIDEIADCGFYLTPPIARRAGEPALTRDAE